MSKQFKIGLIAGIVALMILLVWLLSGSEKQKSEKKPFISSNWSKKFQLYDKNPLGLYLFTSLTKAHLNKQNDLIEINDWVELDSIISADEEKKTFLFVGNNFGLKNIEMDTILKEIEHGSDLFLAYNDLTENLYPILFEEYNVHFDYAEKINVFAEKKKFSMINLHQNDTIACDWKAFGKIVTNGSSYVGISSFMEMNNFIAIEYGDGNIFLHSNPSVFYNYQLKRTSGFKYSEIVLNQLAKDRDIYLLELGRLSDNYGNENVDDVDGKDGKRDDSYLKLIFENPTLLTAMLLSILGLILFVIFRSKRTRPIVPYREDKKDMTMAFAETITSIYFSKRNPYGLLQVQRKNFYSTVHKHFFIDIQRRESDKALEILAEKSDTPREEINELVNLLETKEAFSVDDQYIANIARKQHVFYKKVGIISAALNEKTTNREFIFKRALWLPAVFILSGLFSILLGMSFLIGSIGAGIILLPVGISMLLLGSIRITNPFLKVSSNEMIHYSPIGKKRIFKKDELLSTEIKANGVVLHFKNKKELIINYWDLSRFDKKQFKRFVSKLHTQEL